MIISIKIECKVHQVKSISFDKILEKTNLDFRMQIYGTLFNSVRNKINYNLLIIEAFKDIV